MGDRHKRVIGFYNFRGFGEFDAKDGLECRDVGKVAGGFGSAIFEKQLLDAIEIFDADRFIPYKARIALIKGDIEESLPAFVQKNPSVCISLLHFDVDLCRPTLTGLQQLWPLVVPGGVVLFDEYGIHHGRGRARRLTSSLTVDT